MKIEECGFKPNNVVIGVFENGKVFLGQIGTGEIYQVSIVKKIKSKPFSNVKTIMIDEFIKKENKR